MKETRKWKLTGAITVASILIVIQYVLAFFVFKLPGLEALQWVGWGIWVISLILGFGPMVILRQRGGVAKGKSYVETTRLVDTSLYAIVRHPQYLSGILFNVALILLAQHCLIFLIGIVSSGLIYKDILEADQEGIEKFGDEYRRYMQRVPRANLLLGLVRLIKSKRSSKHQ